VFEEGQLVKIKNYQGHDIYAVIIERQKDSCYRLITEKGLFVTELSRFIYQTDDVNEKEKARIAGNIVKKLACYNINKIKESEPEK
jgi:hypothetical protein